MELTKITEEEAKTSIWQMSHATWVGQFDQLQDRANQAEEWLKNAIPEWIDDWGLTGTAVQHPDQPDQSTVTMEFNFAFLTEMEHGKHNWKGTADQDPRLIAMRELIDRLSNHLDLVTPERFQTNTTGAVYEF